MQSISYTYKNVFINIKYSIYSSDVVTLCVSLFLGGGQNKRSTSMKPETLWRKFHWHLAEMMCQHNIICPCTPESNRNVVAVNGTRALEPADA